MAKLVEDAAAWVQNLGPKQLEQAFQKVYHSPPQNLNPVQLCNLYVKTTGNVKIININTKQ